VSNRIRGVLAPVVTPFDEQGKVDLRRFVEHCRWLVANGVGLAFLGTNSEANSLSLAERLLMMEAVFSTDLDTAAMMPGTGACDLPTAVTLTKTATQAGCAGVLTLPPFYYKAVTEEGLYRFYAELIEQVGEESLRLYLYHIPPVAQVEISIPLVERLLKAYPNQIAGIKDSSGNWSHTQALLKQFQNENFDIFPGSESFLLKGLRNGAVGCISATANVNPAAIRNLYQHWQSDRAEDLQAGLDAIRTTFERYPMIPAMKAVIAHWLKDPQWSAVRPPFITLSNSEQRALFARLNELSFNLAGH